MAARPSSLLSSLLRRRYWALAAGLTLAVWACVALAMRPLREAGGGYAENPYGLTTSLENRATDLLFQLRDARRLDQRHRQHRPRAEARGGRHPGHRPAPFVLGRRDGRRLRRPPARQRQRGARDPTRPRHAEGGRAGAVQLRRRRRAALLRRGAEARH